MGSDSRLVFDCDFRSMRQRGVTLPAIWGVLVYWRSQQTSPANWLYCDVCLHYVSIALQSLIKLQKLERSFTETWWDYKSIVHTWGEIQISKSWRTKICFYILSFWSDSWQQFVFYGEVVVMGYLLHFATFFPLERTLFIHHYLPALFFKIVLLPVMLQHVHQEIFR